MSNIRKSFSFRDGVQVDQDIFVVRGALVGIGTSVPTEDLDVRGVAKVVGLVTTTSLISGASTIGNLRVGIVSIFPGGIVTATSPSGVVTYFGDGGRLLNLPTSQWLDVDVGLGFTSIYAQGNVGIATSNPLYTFQIGSSPDLSRGVGINSTGNIKATGIITARSFVGFGSDISEINALNISSGTISNSRLPVIANDRFAANVSLSGILTASSAYFGSIVSTGNIIGIAETARGLIGSPSIDVWNLTVNRNAVINGIATVTNSVSSGASIGIATVNSLFHVGSGGTILSALNSGRIGIGTNLPSSDFQLRRPSNALFEVIGDSGQSRISIGQSVGIGNSSALLRFGGTPRSFEIINNDYGRFDFYLHSGSQTGVNTGGFNWIYGKSNQNLLALTYTGKLGIGKTNPRETFEVVGTSTVTSDAFVGGDLFISGGVVAGTGINRVSFGSGEENLLNNTNIVATNGISTVSALNVIGVGTIGIQTSRPIAGFDARTTTGLFSAIGIKTERVTADLTVGGKSVLMGGVGIGTTFFRETEDNDGSLRVFGDGITIHDGLLLFKGAFGAIGMGTNYPNSVLDFANARTPFGTKGVFVPPHATDAEIVAMGEFPPAGGIVYNPEQKIYQYNMGNGYPWQNLTGPWKTDIEYDGFTYYGLDFGSVGIGTSLPTATLEVVGSIKASQEITSPTYLSVPDIYCNTIFSNNINGTLTGVSSIFTAGSAEFYGEDGGILVFGGAKLGVNTSPSAHFDLWGDSRVSGILTVTTLPGLNDDSIHGIHLSNGAKVGIGSTRPKADLDIIGNVSVVGILTVSNLVNSSSRLTVGTGVTVGSGIVTAVTGINVGTGVTIRSGIVTATNGFNSGIGTAVRITTSGNRIFFTVPGVGSTSLQLF